MPTPAPMYVSPSLFYRRDLKCYLNPYLQIALLKVINGLLIVNSCDHFSACNYLLKQHVTQWCLFLETLFLSFQGPTHWLLSSSFLNCCQFSLISVLSMKMPECPRDHSLELFSSLSTHTPTSSWHSILSPCQSFSNVFLQPELFSWTLHSKCLLAFSTFVSKMFNRHLEFVYYHVQG